MTRLTRLMMALDAPMLPMMLVSKQSYTSIMGNIGASSAIISRVSRVLSRDDSVLRRLLEESTAPADKTEV